MKKNLKKIISLTVILSLVSLFYPIQPPVVNAAVLTGMKATLSTLKQNTKADQEIMFTLSSGGNGLAANETIILTYDSDIDVTTGLDFEDIDLSYQASPDGVCSTGDTEMTLAAAPVTTTMGVVRTDGQIITFTNGSTTVAAGSEICIQIGKNAAGPGVEQIKNAVTAASDNLVISGTIGGADQETGTIVITSVDNDTVVTTATVLATLSFDVDGDFAIGFGTIAADASRWANDAATGASSATSAHNLTASTNSTSGYTLTVRGDTLESTGTPGDIISAMTTRGALVQSDTEQFGLSITLNGGGSNVTVDADYDDVPAAEYCYNATASVADTIAVCSGLSATTTYDIYYAANISGSTEAHTDYSASLTYVATGNF